MEISWLFVFKENNYLCLFYISKDIESDKILILNKEQKRKYDRLSSKSYYHYVQHPVFSLYEMTFIKAVELSWQDLLYVK